MLFTVVNKISFSRGLLIFMVSIFFPNSSYCQQSTNKIFISVASVQLNIPDKTVVGKINGLSKKLGKKEATLYLGTPNNLDHQIINVFDNSDIVSFNELQNFDDVSPAIKPKLILKASITNLNFELKGGHHLQDLAGPCSITCTWQIYTVDDKLHPKNSIITQTNIQREKKDYELILNDLMTASTEQLLKNDTLFAYLNDDLGNYLNNLHTTPIEISGCKATTSDNSRELLKHAMNSVVTIIANNDFGSGTIISPDGYVLTNYHVTAGEKKLKVKTYTGEILDASLIKSSQDYDIALLKIDGKTFSCLPVAINYAGQSGDNIYAVGTPVDQQFGQSVSKGVISGFRKINGISFIQTDVSLNNGNSGGPILNEDGKVIGIATMKMTGRGIEGIGFAITSDEIIKALNLKLSQ